MTLPVFFPAALLSSAALTDARSGRIPNLLVLFFAFPGGLLLGAPFLWRLLAAVLCFYPFFRLRLMGAGDAKLLSVVSGWLDTDLFLTVLFAGLVLSLPPLTLKLLRGERAALPMAPFFLGGFLVVMLLEQMNRGIFL